MAGTRRAISPTSPSNASLREKERERKREREREREKLDLSGSDELVDVEGHIIILHAQIIHHRKASVTLILIKAESGGGSVPAIQKCAWHAAHQELVCVLLYW